MLTTRLAETPLARRADIVIERGELPVDQHLHPVFVQRLHPDTAPSPEQRKQAARIPDIGRQCHVLVGLVEPLGELGKKEYA